MAKNKSLILFFLIFLLNIQVVNAGKVCKAFRSYIDLIFNKNIAPKEAYGIQKRISNLTAKGAKVSIETGNGFEAVKVVGIEDGDILYKVEGSDKIVRKIIDENINSFFKLSDEVTALKPTDKIVPARVEVLEAPSLPSSSETPLLSGAPDKPRLPPSRETPLLPGAADKPRFPPSRETPLLTGVPDVPRLPPSLETPLLPGVPDRRLLPPGKSSIIPTPSEAIELLGQKNGKIIKFTDRSGEVVSRAELVRVDPDNIVVKIDGIEKSIPLNEIDLRNIGYFDDNGNIIYVDVSIIEKLKLPPGTIGGALVRRSIDDIPLLKPDNFLPEDVGKILEFKYTSGEVIKKGELIKVNPDGIVVRIDGVEKRVPFNKIDPTSTGFLDNGGELVEKVVVKVEDKNLLPPGKKGGALVRRPADNFPLLKAEDFFPEDVGKILEFKYKSGEVVKKGELIKVNPDGIVVRIDGVEKQVPFSKIDPTSTGFLDNGGKLVEKVVVKVEGQNLLPPGKRGGVLVRTSIDDIPLLKTENFISQDVGKMIKFTDRSGEIVSKGELVKVNPDSIVIKSGGIEKKISFGEIDPISLSFLDDGGGPIERVVVQVEDSLKLSAGKESGALVRTSIDNIPPLKAENFRQEDVGKMIKFTDRSGEIVSKGELVKVNPDSIVIKSGGIEKKISFGEIDPISVGFLDDGGGPIERVVVRVLDPSNLPPARGAIVKATPQNLAKLDGSRGIVVLDDKGVAITKFNAVDSLGRPIPDKKVIDFLRKGPKFKRIINGMIEFIKDKIRYLIPRGRFRAFSRLGYGPYVYVKARNDNADTNDPILVAPDRSSSDGEEEATSGGGEEATPEEEASPPPSGKEGSTPEGTVISLSYDSDEFDESDDDDGTFNKPIKITLKGDTFKGEDNTDAKSNVDIEGIPSGLTAEIKKVNSTEYKFSLTGKADSHKVKDKTEMTLTFKDEAFEKNTADKVAEHSKTFKIYFRDDTEEKGEEEDGDAKDDEKAPDFVENKSTFFGPLQKLIKKGWRALGNLW